MQPHLHSLDPIETRGQCIDRSVAYVGERPLVLFHKSGRNLSPRCKFDWTKVLSGFDLGPVVELERSTWQWSKGAATNFNCHAMAIGSHVGLSPQDWLEGIGSPATLDHNPARILLDNFFQHVETVGPGQEPTHSIEENEIFVCYESSSDHFIHSGFIKRVDDRLVAVSKFGEGPILLTSLDLIQAFYHAKFDQVRWYRFQGNGSVRS